MDDSQTTRVLLQAARLGRADARDRLARRFLPGLQAWARGRLPAEARDLADTDDLVQVTLLRALDRVEGFVAQGPGSFLAYLRRSLKNEIVNQIRRVRRAPRRAGLDEQLPQAGPSPLEQAIGREALESYEQGLARLPEHQQEAVILRIELGCSHREVAEAVGCPTENAARMLVARALVRLVEVMHER